MPLPMNPQIAYTQKKLCYVYIFFQMTVQLIYDLIRNLLLFFNSWDHLQLSFFFFLQHFPTMSLTMSHVAFSVLLSAQILGMLRRKTVLPAFGKGCSQILQVLSKICLTCHTVLRHVKPSPIPNIQRHVRFPFSVLRHSASGLQPPLF